MPIYEFQCDSCGVRFEEIVLGKRDTVSCPECGNDRPRRLMSTFSWSGQGGTSSPSACSSCNASPSACSGCSSK